jgi:hypothetical protein
MSKVQEIQRIIGVKDDDVWGKISQGAFDKLLAEHAANKKHSVMASSFADPIDVENFRKCKDEGKTDLECFKIGDNGIGCWGDNTTGPTPMCALPPDDMIEKWGSVLAAKHKKVVVNANNRTVTCVLADRMPWKRNIKNKAGIDLNPAAVKTLGLNPPIMTPATWNWI